MALKLEAVEDFYKRHSLESREHIAALTKDQLRKKAERRHELVEELLSEPWGRELWYDIIAEADVLKMDPMTGNAQTYYRLGQQDVATRNMKWVQTFHFDKWLEMEREARNRKLEADNERGN